MEAYLQAIKEAGGRETTRCFVKTYKKRPNKFFC